MRSWDELTDAERSGVIQRTAVRTLDSPNLREWTAERIRQESPADSFMHLVADAMEVELAAREARSRLRVVVGARRQLPPPDARPGAPSLRVLSGYAPSPFAQPAAQNP
jgi:hypothetical protein